MHEPGRQMTREQEQSAENKIPLQLLIVSFSISMNVNLRAHWQAQLITHQWTRNLLTIINHITMAKHTRHVLTSQNHSVRKITRRAKDICHWKR